MHNIKGIAHPKKENFVIKTFIIPNLYEFLFYI